MKTKDVEFMLSASLISKKANTYTARWSYFYHNGQTASTKVDKVIAVFPNAKILDSGDIFKPFRGGAPISKQSHFFVKFELPVANDKK